jgi:hypothetical protein
LYCVCFLVVMLALVHWKIAEARHSVNISQYIIFTLITLTIFRLLSDVFVSGLARNAVSVFGVAATRFFIYQLNTPLRSLRNTFYLTWTHSIMDQISSLRQPHKDLPRAKDTMSTNIGISFEILN